MRALTCILLACLVISCGETVTTDDASADSSAIPDLLSVDRSTEDVGLAGDRAPPARDTRPLADADPCSRPPAPADRVRYVVVAHPFQSAGGPKAPAFEVLELSVKGALAKTGKTFQLSPAPYGEIAFTRDGKVGLVATDSGTVAAFSLDASGTPQVLHAGFKTKAYASRVVMGPEPDVAYVLSDQWRNIGGGIYRLRIACDGTLTEEGLVAAAKLPYTMTFLPAGSTGQRVVVAARDILSSPASGTDVHLLDWSGKPAWVAGADAFGDDEAIVSSAALTADGRYLLFADTSVFTTGGNRVATVEVLANGLRAAQVLAGLKDPASVVASPHGEVALVMGAVANTITVLDYNPASTKTPFTVRGPLETASKPQLPADAVVITRGQLAGRVIISENLALRQVQLEKGGAVKEIELFSLGTGLTAIPGAIGVQP